MGSGAKSSRQLQPTVCHAIFDLRQGFTFPVTLVSTPHHEPKRFSPLKIQFGTRTASGVHFCQPVLLHLLGLCIITGLRRYTCESTF